MGAVLGDPPFIKDKDLVTSHYTARPLTHDKDRPISGQFPKGLSESGIRCIVQGTCRIVKNQNFGILDKSSCDEQSKPAQW